MGKSGVAVIGAGIAGLSCATALQQAGVNVQVFDKSRGPAGRMSTRRGDGWQCDHGAQYFTARHPDFRAEVARWEQHGVASSWSPRLQVLGGERNGSQDARSSQGPIERFVGTPRMTAPSRFLADSLQGRYETTVKQLQSSENGWRLFSAEHGWWEETFEAVLLAVPAPQATPLMQGVAPDFAELTASATMRGSWALMLRFDEAVALPFDAAFVNTGPLRWMARDNSKPGREGQETWLVHASAEWSEAHIEDEAEEVSRALLLAFNQLGGPAPQAWSAHRWRYADTAMQLEHLCAWDPERKLGLCGDWLNGGKVEGAWLSGAALARRVVG